MSSIKKRAAALVGEGRIREAIESILSVEPFDEIVLMLRFRWLDNQRDFARGIISYKEYEMEENSIVAGLYGIIGIGQQDMESAREQKATQHITITGGQVNIAGDDVDVD